MSTWADKLWIIQVLQQKIKRLTAEDIKIESSSFSDDTTDIKAALEELAERISNLQNS